MKVPINKIKPDPNQPRKTFEDIEGLAKTINREGVLQPLLIDKKYQIIDGERRYKAAKQVGLKELPAIILDDKGKRLAWQCIDDVQHHDFPILERDKAWLKLYKKLGEPTKQAFADILGVSKFLVSDALERATFLPKVAVPLQKLMGDAVTETRFIKDNNLRGKVIEKVSQIGDSRQKRQYIERTKTAIKNGTIDKVLEEPITDYTKTADRVIYSIKTILKELNKGLMLKLPPTQAVILSGYITELQKHLKTWDAEEAKIINN